MSDLEQVAGWIARGPQPGDPVLSVRQPYAWLLVHGYKPIENRTWSTAHRGPLWIHASKAPDVKPAEAEAFLTDDCGLTAGEAEAYDPVLSAVVGCVFVADCVGRVNLPPVYAGNVHAGGPFFFLLSAAAPLAAAAPCDGRLGVWRFGTQNAKSRR
ncbi:MAG: ASCH domain-containing protein [Gemmataceae bacterium]|nr:ASCH domain-containing protein [Gemmataceae bacterium]